MKNRRTTIVINKKFQHHYAMLLVAMTVLVANLFIIGSMLLPGEQRLQLTSSSALFIGLAELMLVGGVWFLSIRSTHRIAGPIYVYSRQLRAFGAGDLTARIHLRDKDMFQEEAAEINGGLDELQAQVVQLKAVAEEIRVTHSAGADMTQPLERMIGALAQLRTEGEG